MIVAVIAIFTNTAYAKKPQLKPVSNLIVVDAKGKKVGDVISFFINIDSDTQLSMVYLPIIFLNINNHIITLTVFSTYFRGNIEDGVFYKSTDCSGIPFVRDVVGLATNILHPLPLIAVNSPGNTVYIADPNSIPVKNPNIQSGRRADNHLCQSTGFGDNTFFIQATPLIDLNTLFTPPFSVQGR